MSETERNDLDPGQCLARDAVRGLRPPAADPAFRARLKDQFVSGHFASAPAQASPPPRAISSRWLRPVAWAALPLAALLVFTVLGLNRLPGPELLAASGTGSIQVNGQTLEAGDVAGITNALKPGSRLAIGGEATLDILYAGSMVWRLAPGTELTLPGRPGRWFDRRTEAELTLGEVSVRTGPDLGGGELVVTTPEGRAVITGTLVSVFRNADLTCVCLFEGSARFETAAEDLGAIPLLKRWVVFADGRPPELLDIAPPHLDHMLGLDRDRAGVFSDR